jgi:hypothetical protein
MCLGALRAKWCARVSAALWLIGALMVWVPLMPAGLNDPFLALPLFLAGSVAALCARPIARVWLTLNVALFVLWVCLFSTLGFFAGDGVLSQNELRTHPAVAALTFVSPIQSVRSTRRGWRDQAVLSRA